MEVEQESNSKLATSEGGNEKYWHQLAVPMQLGCLIVMAAQCSAAMGTGKQWHQYSCLDRQTVQTLNSVLYFILSFPPTSLFWLSVRFQIPSLCTFDTYSITYVVPILIFNRTGRPIKLRWKSSTTMITTTAIRCVLKKSIWGNKYYWQWYISWWNRLLRGITILLKWVLRGIRIHHMNNHINMNS